MQIKKSKKNPTATRMRHPTCNIKKHIYRIVYLEKKSVIEQYLIAAKYSHRVPAAASRGYPASIDVMRFYYFWQNILLTF